MAVVPCPDCGETISSAAGTCPHCGAEVKHGWKKSEKIAAAAASISLFTLVLGVLGAWIAYGEFQVQDNWKRREFVVAQIKEFYGDLVNRNVLLMLDYNPATIELYPAKSNPSERVKDVPFAQFVKTISSEDNRGDDLLIRIQFEHFLQALRRFNYLVSYKAIAADELCADLEYPLSNLAGDPATHDRKLRNGRIDITPLAEGVAHYVNVWDDEPIRQFILTMGKACHFQTPFLSSGH
jgi:hypothetical protein